MATLISTVVDPGGTGNYLSLNAAEAANFGASGVNFVGNDERAECECRCTNGNADTTAVLIQGQTCDATRNIRVFCTSPYKHAGVFPAAASNIYRMSITGEAGGGIVVNVPFVEIDGISIAQTPIGNNLYIVNASTLAASFKFSNSIVWSTNGDFVSTSCTSIAAAYTAYIWNCVIYGMTGAGGRALMCGTSDLAVLYAYNNTIYNNGFAGLSRFKGTFVAKNNLVWGNGSFGAFYGTFQAGTTHNGRMTDVAAATGDAAPVDLGANVAAVFADAASSNFLLASAASPAVGVGTPLDSDLILPVTTDMLGNTRSLTAPCLGAHEYTAPAGGTPTTGLPSLLTTEHLRRRRRTHRLSLRGGRR